MNELDRRALLGVAGIAGLASIASRAGAGPLDPPAGPVAPTGRTTDELFDRTAQAARYTRPSTPIGPDTTPGDAFALRIISEPGRYHLTANLIVPPEYSVGINVTAPGVTIDLNGFAIIATPNTTPTAVKFDGVGSAVLNGYIALFGGFAVDFSSAESARVEGITFDRCGTGVWASDFAMVSRCTFHQCSGVPLHTETGAIVTDCTFKLCAGSIELDQGIMERCTVLTLNRIAAVLANNGSILRSCSINATVSDGPATEATPITLSQNSRMEHCAVVANTKAIVVRALGASVVAHCNIRNYTQTSSIIYQVELNDASIMHDCLIRKTDQNGGITAVMGSACVFKGNTVVGTGLVTGTATGTPRGAVYSNTAFTGAGVNFVFDTGPIGAPVHVATATTAMPASFSAFGNIVGS
ncbi:MAG: hypothetical protein J0L61_01070 [Planctomycetes bacterium]|nr:hypothetical protein [Planctomycetota bacterium]